MLLLAISAILWTPAFSLITVLDISLVRSVGNLRAFVCNLSVYSVLLQQIFSALVDAHEQCLDTLVGVTDLLPARMLRPF